MGLQYVAIESKSMTIKSVTHTTVTPDAESVCQYDGRSYAHSARMTTHSYERLCICGSMALCKSFIIIIIIIMISQRRSRSTIIQLMSSHLTTLVTSDLWRRSAVCSIATTRCHWRHRDANRRKFLLLNNDCR